MPDEMTREAKQVWVGASRNTSPPKAGQTELLRYYREHPTLHQIPGKIAERMAGIQWTVLRAVGPGGKSVRNKALQRAPYEQQRKMIHRSADGVEELTDDPLIDFLEAGNTVLTGYEAREVMALHFELVGDAVSWIERDAFGLPVRYWPLPPTWVREMATIGREYYRLDVYGHSVYVPSEQIWRIRSPDPYDPYARGIGKGEALGDELDTEEYASGFVKAFFYNNAVPAGVVMFEGIEKENLERVEQDWDVRHRGGGRAHRMHFLSDKADIELFPASFKDMNIVELRKNLRAFIRETWGVPPEIVGFVENSNRATIDAATDIFAREIILPRAERWRRSIQNQIVPLFDERKIVSFESPVPDDRDHKLEVMRANPAAFTRAQWKLAAGEEPIDGVDDVYVMGLASVERPSDGSPAVQLVKPTAPPAPTPEMIEESIRGYQEKKVTKADARIINELAKLATSEILAEHTADVWPRWVETWGAATLADLGSDVVFNRTDPRVLSFLLQYAGAEGKLALINDTTREALVMELAAGVEAGEGHAALAKRVRSVFTDASYRRATLISRTEVTRAANFATTAAFEQSGVVREREWVATQDGRAREIHAAMDGKRAMLGELFVLGDGSVCDSPGNTGQAKHDCNCRCTTIAVIPEKTLTADERKEVWKGFDNSLLPWEREVENAFRDAFQAQEAIILERLALLV